MTMDEGRINRLRVLVVLLAAAAAWSIFVIWNVHDYWGDSYAYLNDLKAALSHGYGSFIFGTQQHPLYPLVLYGLGKLTGNAYFAGKLLSVVSYMFTLFFVYEIGELLGGLKTGIVAVILCTVVFLDYATVSVAVLSGPFFSAIFFAAVYNALRERYVPAALLLGVLPFVRNEYTIVIVSFICIYVLQKQLRRTIQLLAINVLPFAVWFYFFFLHLLQNMRSETRAVVKGVLGHRSVQEVILTPFERFATILVGSAGWPIALLLGILFVIPFADLRVSAPNDKKYIDTSSPTFFVGLLFLLNFCGLLAAYYMGFHPLSKRHFGYVVPLFALLVARGLVLVEARVGRIVSPVSKAHVVVATILLLLFASVYMHGRFDQLSHAADGVVDPGEWLAGRLHGGKKLICPDPGVLYYSGYGYGDTVPYPANISSIAGYKRENVKYVAWTGLWCTGNLEARTKLKSLADGRNYLFFKHEYSPPYKGGWYGTVYSIDENLLKRFTVTLGTGWMPKESWGRWADGRVSTILFYSPTNQTVTLSFRAGAYVEPAELAIYVGDNLVSRVTVGLKTDDTTTPTWIDVPIRVNRGQGTIKFIGPSKMFVPKERGDWNFSYPLRLAYSDISIDGVRVF